jgi:tetratricopeptide (TPR) repeat protein
MTLLSAADTFAQANAAYVDEDFAEALSLYNHAIELDGNSPDYYTKRSTVLFKLKRFEDALTDAEKSLHLLQVSPNLGEALKEKALLRKGYDVALGR